MASLSYEHSLIRAAEVLRESPFSLAPVVSDGHLAGVVTELSLMRALAKGSALTDGLIAALVPAGHTLNAYDTGASALRYFESSGAAEALVVTPDGRVVGIITPADLFPKADEYARPPFVGGMATPFGVYLTNGNIAGGASGWALLSTGALLFTIFLAAAIAMDQLSQFLVRQGSPIWLASAAYEAGPLILFLVGVRMLPLSGIHAAEHKVVHAIERGEPLEIDVVRRMPRVHPRCGTNIAVGASLFLGISQSHWIPWADVRLLAAMLATLFFWRPLGNLVQLLVTTKPPTDAQLRMGIASANELLEKYRYDPRPPLDPLRRILVSGMLHVLAGSFLAFGVAWAIAKAFRFDLGI